MNQPTSPFQSNPYESPALGEPPETPVYTHPDDVVGDPRLTSSQKRAILASWMSDARAVENAPGLRRLDSGAVVEFDVIRRSLNAIDPPESRKEYRERALPAHRRGSVISRLLNRVAPPSGSNDNDDDPPPAPAGLRAPFRPTFVMAHGARPERPRACAVA